MQIRIVDDHNALVRETWEFTTLLQQPVIKVRLDLFAREHRPSKRHRKWETTRVWSYRGGMARVYRREFVLDDQPKIPPYILARLKREFDEAVRWPE